MKEILYLKIYNRLKTDITSGASAPGSKLMGIRELAEHFGTSHKTISRSLECLEKDGLVRITQGQGIFVREKSSWRQDPGIIRELGIILNDMTIPFNVKLSSILEQRASESGYRMVIRSTGYEPGKQKTAITELTEAGAAGLVIVPAAAEEAPVVYGNDSMPPAIFAGEFSPSTSFTGHYIAVDSYSGFYSAVTMLNEAGHELIGYIGASSRKESEPGYLACRDALAGRRRGYRENYFVSAGGYEAGHGSSAMKELLLNEEFPTAVVCFSDTLAAGAVKACREAGLQVPGDISILGSGDQEIATLIDPPLTTLKPPVELTGLLTIHLLDDLINRRIPDGETIKIRLDMELITRGSVSGTVNGEEGWT